MPWVYNCTPKAGNAEAGGFLELPEQQPSLTGKLQANERHCLKENRWNSLG